MAGNKRTVILTGASRGIGKAIALALAAEGYNLALCARSADKLEETEKQCLEKGIEVLVIPADLTKPEVPGEVIEKTVKHFGHVDVLINNAGYAKSAALDDVTLDDWNMMMDLNARAPFLLAKHTVPFLKKSKDGVIINISSVVGRKGYPNQLAYSASKHALTGLTRVLGRELQQEGIRVHLISPGGVSTDMIHMARPDLDPYELIQPEEIADLVVFILNSGSKGLVDEFNVRRRNSMPFD